MAKHTFTDRQVRQGLPPVKVVTASTGGARRLGRSKMPSETPQQAGRPPVPKGQPNKNRPGTAPPMFS